MKILIDTDQYVVYRYTPTGGLIAFDYQQAARIRQLLSLNGKIFHQIPETEKLTGQWLETNASGHFVLSGNLEVVQVQNLDHLPLSTRIALDIKRLLGIKPNSN